MKIEISTGRDSYGYARQEMKIDDKERLSVAALYYCPEDAIIGRDLVSCEEVASFMREAYEAGMRGEELFIDVIAEHDDA